MNFHDIRFPPKLSFGSVGGPERRTDVVTLANGFEERNTPWAHSRRRYDAGVGMRSMDDIETLIAFFEARRGRLFGFRWKDWSDFKTAAPSRDIHYRDCQIGVGDGEQRVFQLQKLYHSGDHSYARPITKPVGETVLAGTSVAELTLGVHYEVDESAGLITFTDPPEMGQEVTAGFEFDVPVRFDSDGLHISVEGFEAGDVPSVPVVEIRL